MLHVVSWYWKGGVILPQHVNSHHEMMRKAIAQPFRYLCVTDNPDELKCETFPLWDDHASLANPSGPDFPRCYRRLKIFDPDTLLSMGIQPGDRVVSIDLDVVAVDRLDPLLDRDGDFVGWVVPGARRQAVYNGTIFMHRAGSLPWLWSEFDPKTSPQLAKRAGYFGSDQGWLSHRLVETHGGWTRDDGVISYMTDCRLTGRLPSHARLVSFHGRTNTKPWNKQTRAKEPWIKNFWKE